MDNSLILSIDFSPKGNASKIGVILINKFIVDWQNKKVTSLIFDMQEMNESEIPFAKWNFIISHNFWGYDGIHLPSAFHDPSKIIDTLFLSLLFNFDSAYHHLDKSVINTSVEDALNSVKILENIFTKLLREFNKEELNLIYSLTKDNKFFKWFWELVKLLPGFDLKQIDIFSIWNLFKAKSIEIWRMDDLSSEESVWLAYTFLFRKYKKPILPAWFFEEMDDNDDISNFKNKVRDFLNVNYKNLGLFYERNIRYHEIRNINNNLKTYFGFAEFKSKIQKEWIVKTLESMDFLVLMPTWWGKSLIYQLPAKILGDKLGYLTVVISPLKALIKDHFSSLRDRWWHDVEVLIWDLSPLEEDKVKENIKSGKTKLLLVSPEKLRSESFLKLLSWRYVDRFVLDEAHTLINWGKEFRFDYFFVREFIKDLESVWLNNKINLTLLSATVPNDVLGQIKKYFQWKDIKIISWWDVVKRNILPRVIEVDEENKSLEKLRIILETEKYSKAIVFVRKTETADFIVNKLNEMFKIERYYAGLSPDRKREIEKKFRNRDIKIIVATKAFGMGVDDREVDLVIHFNLPQSLSDYVQEIGRAWRLWQKAKNIILVTDNDYKEIDKLISRYKLSPDSLIAFIRKLALKIDSQKWGRQKVLLSQKEIKKMANLWYLRWKDVKTIIDFIIWFWENEGILRRRYNQTYIIANKINEKINLNELYREIEDQEKCFWVPKNLIKAIARHMIEKRRSLDLLNIEDEKRWLNVKIEGDISDKQFEMAISCLIKYNVVSKIEKDVDMLGEVYWEELENLKYKLKGNSKFYFLLKVFLDYIGDTRVYNWTTNKILWINKKIISIGRLKEAIAKQENNNVDIKYITDKDIRDFLWYLHEKNAFKITHAIVAFFTKYQLIVDSQLDSLIKTLSGNLIEKRLNKLIEEKRQELKNIKEIINILKKNDVNQYYEVLSSYLGVKKF